MSAWIRATRASTASSSGWTASSWRPPFFHLACTCDSDYLLHEAVPFCVGLSIWATNRLPIGESLRFFN